MDEYKLLTAVDSVLHSACFKNNLQILR